MKIDQEMWPWWVHRYTDRHMDRRKPVLQSVPCYML